MPTDQVDQAKTVEPEARDVPIVHEVLPTFFGLVVGVPVTPNSQYGVGALLERDDVRYSDAVVFGELVGVVDVPQVVVQVHLNDLEPVVRGRAEALLLRFLFLHIVQRPHGVAQVHILVEPRHLQLTQFILGLAHPVRHTLGTVKGSSSVRHHDVLGRDIHRHLPVHVGVEVDLLERVACQRQCKQRPLMLRTELQHLLGQLVVHIFFDTGGGFFFLPSLLANDHGLDRPCSGERLHDGLGLELDRALHQHRVEYPAGTGPWLGTLLDLDPQELQTLDVSVKPVFAALNVLIKLRSELRGQDLQLATVKNLSEVLLELVIFFSGQFFFKPIDIHFDLDFNLGLGNHRQPHRGFIQRLVYAHLKPLLSSTPRTCGV